ncbi:MAG: OmpA family protein [Pikeienuella sp.]|uniref:OmpA family protein n=1 Tax=Pikeienuella sp. TaxID=2831957 RepID=UPI003919B531
MKRPLLLGLALWAAAALAAALLGREGARLAEAAAALRAEAALGPAGHSWARLEADGLRLTLRGEAPGEAAREAAFAALSAAAVLPVPGFSVMLANEAGARAQPEVFRPEAEAILMRGLSDIAISGAAPGRLARAALLDALEAAGPGLALVDLSRDDAAGSAARWEEGAAAAAEIAAALLHGRVSYTPERIAFSGVAAGPAEISRIETAMAAAEAAGWRVEADIAALPVSAPAFILHAETGDGGRGAIACMAGTPEAAAALDARLAAAPGLGAGVGAGVGSGVGSGGAPCLLAPGAPPGWDRAAEAGLDALLTLPAAEFRMTGRRARLSARPPTRRLALEAAGARLRAALPEGYSLAVLTGGADVPDDADDGSERETGANGAAPAPLLIRREPGRMAVSGGAPDPLIGESLAAYARVAAPGATVEADFVYGGAFDPAWRAAAMTAVAALARLEEGEAEIGAASARLEGRVETPLAIAEIHRMFASGIGGARVAETRLAVSPARIAARQMLPPGRCAEEMTAIAAADPIRFAPGSAALEEGDQAVIRALSGALRRCEGGRIEIGGHTDSQGREALNLALSAARAEAVLAALVQAGARLTLLSARGYGEAQPIADNGTDEGRARNRRIEFRALEVDKE